uniref:Peptidase M12B domain-containing protein n=1 Tax=Parascaris equorum TaxID=6256 RepID=A0A914RVI5_PAREQ
MQASLENEIRLGVSSIDITGDPLTFNYKYIRDAEQHLLDFSLALINNVHVLYQQSSMSPNLDIVIVHWTRYVDASQWTSTNFIKWAAINPGTDLTDPGHWDHGILLTGYDIYHTTTSVAGVAPVARMCDEIFACSLVEGLHLGRSFVLAHEMGHKYV